MIAGEATPPELNSRTSLPLQNNVFLISVMEVISLELKWEDNG